MSLILSNIKEGKKNVQLIHSKLVKEFLFHEVQTLILKTSYVSIVLWISITAIICLYNVSKYL